MTWNRKRLLALLAVLVTILSVIPNIKSIANAAPPRVQQLSIQERINNADNGSTINILPGIYQENITINKPLRILGENKSTTIIQANATDVIKISANNVYISGFTIRNGGNGTKLTASNCTVTGNVFYNNSFGIVLSGTVNNTISENILINNSRASIGSGILLLDRSTKNVVINNTIISSGEAVYVLNSDNNTITQNFMQNNFKTGTCLMKGSTSADHNKIYGNVMVDNHFGIDIYGVNHNVIFNNTLKNNGEGFEIENSNNNTFYQNNITHSWKGMYLLSSNNNTFYYNNILYNYIQISVDKSHESVNTWDNDSKGNYWSDYVGLDQNGDGIGDKPYTIPSDGQDHYPLMKAYPWMSWTLHDIGIVNLAMSKSIIGQGRTISCSITVFNYGSSTENFNLTVYANSTVVIAFTNVTLANQNFTTLSALWNTNAVPCGTYILKAVATPVPDEIDTTDNTQIYGIYGTVQVTTPVKVTIPGDINGDFVVNESDVQQVRPYWQQKSPPVTVNMDINDDCIINIKDVSIIGVNWYKHA